jgi:uncharacterized membrane protein YfcA
MHLTLMSLVLIFAFSLLAGLISGLLGIGSGTFKVLAMDRRSGDFTYKCPDKEILLVLRSLRNH